MILQESGEWSLLMDGVDKMAGKMLPMTINEMTTYEAVDGTFVGFLFLMIQRCFCYGRKTSIPIH